MQCKARRDAQGGPCASGATLQCAVQTTFPKGLHQNRRWTALRSLRVEPLRDASHALPAPILVQTRALLLMK
jgi:hypothetical protein